VSHQGWREEENHLSRPAGNCLMLSQRLLADCHKGTLLGHVQLGVHQDPQVISTPISSWLAPAYTGAQGYPSPRARLCLSFLNFRTSLLAPSSRLVRSLLTAAQPAGVSTIPPSFVLSTKLLWTYPAPSATSLTKMLNSTGPRIEPWGTLLVTGLQLDFVPPVTTHRAWQIRHFSPHLTVHFSSLYFTRLSTLWESVESLNKVKINNIHRSPLSHQASYRSFTHIKTVR